MNKNKNNTRNSNKVERYFGEIQRLPSGEFLVKWAEKRTKINQHLTKWVRVPARSLARALNNSPIVIK